MKTWGEVLNYVNELGLLVGGESSGTQRKWETPMLCGNAKIPMSFFWNSLKYFCKHKNIPTSTSAQSKINMVWGMSMSIKWRRQFYAVYFRSLPLTSISKWSGATILLASWTKCPVHKKKSDMWSFQSRELSQCHICWSWMWRNRLFNRCRCRCRCPPPLSHLLELDVTEQAVQLRAVGGRVHMISPQPSFLPDRHSFSEKSAAVLSAGGAEKPVHHFYHRVTRASPRYS